MTNADLSPDIPHDPRLVLDDEPRLVSPTSHLEPKNGNGAHTPEPARPCDGSLKAKLRAILVDFFKRELA